MSALIVFFLFLLKHAITANLIDVGYSQSRRPHTLAVCWLYLSYHILFETLGSLLLLGLVAIFTDGHQLWRWESFLIAEGLGQILAWAYERRSSMERMLVTHLLSELSFLSLYCILVATLYPF